MEYVEDADLKLSTRFINFNNELDILGKFETDYTKGKPLLDNFYQEYMGKKSKKYELENEMRIILGIWNDNSAITPFLKKNRAVK